MEDRKACSRDDCPPANVKKEITVNCGKCNCTIHLMCIGIAKTADEVLFHKNIFVVCNSCLYVNSTSNISNLTSNSSTSISTPSSSKVLAKTPKNTKNVSVDITPKSTTQRSMYDFTRPSPSIDKTDEMLSLLHDIKSSISKHRNETKSYAAVLSEIKESTRKPNYNANSNAFPMYSSVAQGNSSSNNNDFPSLTSRPSKRKINEISSLDTPKRMRTSAKAGSIQKSVFSGRKLISGTNNEVNHGLGSPVKIIPRTTQKSDFMRKLTKFIYLSRLKTNVTDQLISTYIKSNITGVSDDDFALRMLVKKDQDLTELSFISYRLNCTNELFDKLMEPSFWPSHVMIGEFIERKKNNDLGSFLQKSLTPITQKSPTMITITQTSTEALTQPILPLTQISETSPTNQSPMDTTAIVDLVN